MASEMILRLVSLRIDGLSLLADGVSATRRHQAPILIWGISQTPLDYTAQKNFGDPYREDAVCLPVIIDHLERDGSRFTLVGHLDWSKTPEMTRGSVMGELDLYARTADLNVGR